MKAYVINLARRPDRMRLISEQLKILGINFTRIEAIDGASLPDDPDALIDRASIGCWLSHRSVFIEASKDDVFGSVLVLEDDAALSSSIEWPSFLEETEVNMVRSKIDILQLGILELSQPTMSKKILLSCLLGFRWLYRYATNELGIYNEREIKFGKERLVLNTFSAGSHCYLISRKAARCIIHLNDPAFLTMDRFLLELAGSRQIKVARLKRSLAGQLGRTLDSVSDTNIEGA